jgi:hypothetical protein
MAIENPTLSPPVVDPATFRERGYTVVRGLFSAEEVKRLRAIALETAAEAEREGRLATQTGKEGTTRARGGDLLSMPSLRHVLLDPRVVGVMSQLIGGEPVYFGDSSFRVGKCGLRGWHRDNVNRRRWRKGPDWSDPYPLLRCGLYLQDSARHSGGLALRPGSSRLGAIRPTLPKLVDNHPGDLIVWTLRTVHSAEVVRLRGLPGLPLHPRLQTWLPPSLRAAEDGERIVLFMTFGGAGEQLDYYIDYLKQREDMKGSWACSRFGPEVWAQAEQAGLRVLQPVPEYGSAPDGA